MSNLSQSALDAKAKAEQAAAAADNILAATLCGPVVAIAVAAAEVVKLARGEQPGSGADAPVNRHNAWQR